MIPDFLRDWFVSAFYKCRKCKQKIDAKKGYWFFENTYPQLGGYYHTECGTIGNEDFTNKFIRNIKLFYD